jgi:hypothetical protein
MDLVEQLRDPLDLVDDRETSVVWGYPRLESPRRRQQLEVDL